MMAYAHGEDRVTDRVADLVPRAKYIAVSSRLSVDGDLAQNMCSISGVFKTAKNCTYR
jgi:hypothetical protein